MDSHSATVRVAMLRGDRKYDIPVVSDARHRDAQAAFAVRDDSVDDPAPVALLLPDAGASTGQAEIAVILGGAPVGYLAPEDAELLAEAIAAAGFDAARCAARFIGGPASTDFQIKLDILKPIRFEEAVTVELDTETSAGQEVAQAVQAPPVKPSPVANADRQATAIKSRKRRKLAGLAIVVVVIIVAIVALKLQQSGPT
jgi:hypothetical protein